MEITLRYLALDDEMFSRAILLDALKPDKSRSAQRKAIEELGIEIKEGERPLDAWLRAMCEENGLAYAKPAPKELSEAITFNKEAMRFMWLIS